MKAAIYNQLHVPDVYDKYCSLYRLFSFLFLLSISSASLKNFFKLSAIYFQLFSEISPGIRRGGFLPSHLMPLLAIG